LPLSVVGTGAKSTAIGRAVQTAQARKGMPLKGRVSFAGLCYPGRWPQLPTQPQLWAWVPWVWFGARMASLEDRLHGLILLHTLLNGAAALETLMTR
jgi:hypothetical protein